MSKTATQIAMEENLRVDLRRRRAESFVERTMKALDGVIPDERRLDAYYVLLDAYIEAGIEALTDRDRQEAGLAPRDGTGWTPNELRALELHRLEVMCRPIFMTIEREPPSKG